MCNICVKCVIKNLKVSLFPKKKKKKSSLTKPLLKKKKKEMKQIKIPSPSHNAFWLVNFSQKDHSKSLAA